MLGRSLLVISTSLYCATAVAFTGSVIASTFDPLRHGVAVTKRRHDLKAALLASMLPQIGLNLIRMQRISWAKVNSGFGPFPPPIDLTFVLFAIAKLTLMWVAPAFHCFGSSNFNFRIWDSVIWRMSEILTT